MDALPPGVPLEQIPLAANPNGDPPNFVDPPSLLAAVQAVGIILGFFALILLVTRLVIVHRAKRKFGLDDASAILAFVCAAVYTGASCALGEGITRHAWDTPLSEVANPAYLKKLFVTSLFYGPMLFFAKAAILLFLQRTFQPKTWFRICIYILLFLMTGTYWMTVPLCFYYCMPHPNTGEQWDLTILAKCNALATPGLVQAGMNVAVDIAVFCLPLPVVFKLQMPLGKKLSVAGIFATGLFALIASILTIHYRILIIRGVDSSWAGAQTYICIQAEVYTSIMVACMPSLARVWNSKLVKESKIYTSFRTVISQISFGTFTLASGNSSRPSRKSRISAAGQGPYVKHSESTSHLRGGSGKGFTEINYGDPDLEGNHRGVFGGIQQTTTVELTSVRVDGGAKGGGEIGR
ncbi:hypothetical protein QBC40DRAFT_286089 [Triangularia verruculosa]|uniref:Rhodopsin domain-containing protein n=1 Tax=Triangularia verruculosa TaxID=2587418 RepID=A0AAN6XG47_9PEZI|nr:hypothetical protein QBC40DRAFT_286089 [Triangularia verruculosa]